MSIKFITRPIPSAIGKGKGGYRGQIIGRAGGRSFEEIATAVAGRSSFSAAHAICVFTEIMDEMIRDACKTGNIQHLGQYGTLALILHGRFNGSDDRFDPARHSLDFKFTPGPLLKNPKTTFEFENTLKATQITIDSIVGYPGERGISGTRHMIWGRETLCTGCGIKLREGDTAVWSCKLADNTEHSGPLDVFENDKAVLNFRWPNALPEAAIGREITLRFIFRGERDDGTPVSRKYKVMLYPSVGNPPLAHGESD